MGPPGLHGSGLPGAPPLRRRHSRPAPGWDLPLRLVDPGSSRRRGGDGEVPFAPLAGPGLVPGPPSQPGGPVGLLPRLRVGQRPLLSPRLPPTPFGSSSPADRRGRSSGNPDDEGGSSLFGALSRRRRSDFSCSSTGPRRCWSRGSTSSRLEVPRRQGRGDEGRQTGQTKRIHSTRKKTEQKLKKFLI